MSGLIRIAIIGFFGILSLGCAADRLATFDEAQLKPYAESGTSSITGQAFLKTRGGDVKYGAGNTVMLVPAIDYTKEDLERVVIRGEFVKGMPRSVWDTIDKYIRRSTADGSGNFEFHSIPAGDYILYCNIIWAVAGGGGLESTGGAAYGSASVKDGETVKVVVTRH